MTGAIRLAISCIEIDIILIEELWLLFANTRWQLFVSQLNKKLTKLINLIFMLSI